MERLVVRRYWRDPLRNGYRYPVGRERFDDVLRSAGVGVVDRVSFTSGQLSEYDRKDWAAAAGVGPSWRAGGSVLEIVFRAPTQDRGERVEVKLYAVPSKLRAAIDTALLDGVLRDAARWLAAGRSSGNAWRATDHCLAVRWDGACLQSEERVGVAATRWSPW